MVGVDLPKRVFENFLTLPPQDRNFVTMATDGHGFRDKYAHARAMQAHHYMDQK